MINSATLTIDCYQMSYKRIPSVCSSVKTGCAELMRVLIWGAFFCTAAAAVSNKKTNARVALPFSVLHKNKGAQPAHDLNA